MQFYVLWLIKCIKETELNTRKRQDLKSVENEFGQEKWGLIKTIFGNLHKGIYRQLLLWVIKSENENMIFFFFSEAPKEDMIKSSICDFSLEFFKVPH